MSELIVLIIGDVVGKPGRKAVMKAYSRLKQEHGVDFFIANCENVAGGSGITTSTAQEMFSYGVDVITMGDHIWGNREGYQIIEHEQRLLRPANYPENNPGRGYCIRTHQDVKIGVVNLVGRVFMKPIDCPFTKGWSVVQEIRNQTSIIFVDMHAEATSEKIAMGRYLDGKVSAVLGTHTHVQTADECILPGGTAYITDLGMTGPHESILGREITPVVSRFVTQMPHRFNIASGDLRVSGVVTGIDCTTGKANWIKRLHQSVE